MEISHDSPPRPRGWPQRSPAVAPRDGTADVACDVRGAAGGSEGRRNQEEMLVLKAKDGDLHQFTHGKIKIFTCVNK